MVHRQTGGEANKGLGRNEEEKKEEGGHFEVKTRKCGTGENTKQREAMKEAMTVLIDKMATTSQRSGCRVLCGCVCVCVSEYEKSVGRVRRGEGGVVEPTSVCIRAWQTISASEAIC